MKLLNTLFEITIYSAVLFAAVTGFKLAFKNKLSPALHFTLWFLVIARLCIPVTIESGFHLFTVEQEKPLVQQQIPEVSAFDAPTPAAMREAAPNEALHSEASAPVQEPLPAADVMLLRDDLADAAAAVRISRAVDARIAQNTRMALVYSALLPLLAAGVLYPLNFVLHPIDSVILMTLFVAWLLSGTARLNSIDPKPASQSEPQKEPAE